MLSHSVLPYIIPFSFDGEANSGDNVQLTCHVSKGDRPLQLSWNFHGRELSSHMGLATTKIGDSISVLVIASVAAGHSGNYTCTARNPAGMANHTATLQVNGTATADSNNSLLTVNFLCPASGNICTLLSGQYLLHPNRSKFSVPCEVTMFWVPSHLTVGLTFHYHCKSSCSCNPVTFLCHLHDFKFVIFDIAFFLLMNFVLLVFCHVILTKVSFSLSLNLDSIVCNLSFVLLQDCLFHFKKLVLRILCAYLSRNHFNICHSKVVCV